MKVFMFVAGVAVGFFFASLAMLVRADRHGEKSLQVDSRREISTRLDNPTGGR